mmetsp:Transcript_62481/g.118103  ORF Transcript_62481/g.118103 Transcript_62481/m.118103 type:complete len:497 (+) Transcript_62481:101-1591(+)
MHSLQRLSRSGRFFVPGLLASILSSGGFASQLSSNDFAHLDGELQASVSVMDESLQMSDELAVLQIDRTIINRTLHKVTTLEDTLWSHEANESAQRDKHVLTQIEDALETVMDTNTAVAIIGVIGTFALAGFGSVVWAVMQPLKDTEAARDPLWDCAKFFLLLMVYTTHMYGKMHFYNLWYMACFFMISGLFVDHSDSLFTQKDAIRVLSDTVLNQLFFRSMCVAFLHRAPAADFLWFLTALAAYRLCLLPTFKVLRRGLVALGVGNRLGAFGSCAALVVLIIHLHAFDMKSISHPNPPGYLALHHGAAYVMSLLIDREAFRLFLSTWTAFVFGLVIMLVHIHIRVFDFSWYRGPYSEFLSSIYGTYPVPFMTLLMMIVYELLVSSAFLACVTQLVEIQNVVFQKFVRFVACCGSRTLYGYLLHMYIRYLVQGRNFRHFGDMCLQIHPVFLVVSELLLLIGLCSPLAEKCFAWLVSPLCFVQSSLTAKRSSLAEHG